MWSDEQATWVRVVSINWKREMGNNLEVFDKAFMGRLGFEEEE